MPEKRYAMYLRKSREDVEAERIGHFETLARHEKQLWSYARQLGINGKISEADVYRELVSGDSLAERPECRKLLEKVSAGEYSGVLAVDIDRISRGDMIDQGTISSVFRYSNTPILTPGKIYNPDDDYDMQFMEMRLMFARIEYESIKKRMSAGRIRSVTEGQYIGSFAPYGWDKVTISGKHTLEPNADGSRLVRMYEDVASGVKGTQQIANELNELGVPSPRSKN